MRNILRLAHHRGQQRLAIEHHDSGAQLQPAGREPADALGVDTMLLCQYACGQSGFIVVVPDGDAYL
jgi:hypothetical protein